METVVRVLVVYLFILAGLRVIGKREFSQLSPFELVTLLLIPEIVSQALTREDYSMTNALVGVSTLFCLVFATSVIAQRSTKMEKVIDGTPSVLVHHGRFIEKALNQERVTPGEVMEQARMAGIERPDQIRWAILETDGRISIVPEDQSDSGGNQQDEPAL